MATENKIATISYANAIGYSLSGDPSKCVKESDLPEQEWATINKEFNDLGNWCKPTVDRTDSIIVFVYNPNKHDIIIDARGGTRILLQNKIFGCFTVPGDRLSEISIINQEINDLSCYISTSEKIGIADFQRIGLRENLNILKRNFLTLTRDDLSIHSGYGGQVVWIAVDHTVPSTTIAMECRLTLINTTDSVIDLGSGIDVNLYGETDTGAEQRLYFYNSTRILQPGETITSNGVQYSPIMYKTNSVFNIKRVEALVRVSGSGTFTVRSSNFTLPQTDGTFNTIKPQYVIGKIPANQYSVNLIVQINAFNG